MYGGSHPKLAKKVRAVILSHLAAVTLAYLLDKWIGDPSGWPHPVRWMGRWIAFLDSRLNQGKGRKLKGIIMLAAVLAAVALPVFFSTMLLYRIHPIAGIIWEGILISIAIAQKSLADAAMDVYRPLAAGDLNEARLKLSFIVGRDTESLSEQEITRGTVETVAENTSDGITAPLFWGLAGGAVGALAYRAINTCDSMVGYRNGKYAAFGWASARLDDAVNWIPSRLTGILIMLSKRPQAATFQQAWRILLRDAKKHPSPNSGWGEAAAAAVLGVQLGGANFYKGIVSHRAKMGEPLIALHPNHILAAVELMKRSVLLFLLVLWIGGLAIEITASWIQSARFI